MSHEVQLSPAAAHCPTAVLDPAGHAAELPGPPQLMPVSPGRTCAGYCPTLEIRSARPSFTLRQRFPGDPGTGTAGSIHAVLPRSAGRPDSREEGSSAGPPWATCARRLRAEPSRQRSASQPHDRDRPASYPAEYLPSTPRRPATPPGAGQPQRPGRRIRFCR